MNLFKHDFYYPQLRKTDEEIEQFLAETKKEILYTLGFAWKNPAIHNIPITNEKALEIFHSTPYVKITEHKDFVIFNIFTENDFND